MANNQDEGKRGTMLEKQREDMLQDYARQKEAMIKETEKSKASAADRFTSRTEGLDEALKKSTVGLVTLDDFRKTRSDLEEAQRILAAQDVVGMEKTKEAARERERKEERERKRKKKQKSKLSFAMDGEEEEEVEVDRKNGNKRGNDDVGEDEGRAKKSRPTPSIPPVKPLKTLKNPSVDTSFLPDRDREALERVEREALRRKWVEEQERVKGEGIEITWSFWDGTGHRKTTQCKKGDTIAQFLDKCRAHFPDLKNVSVDSMMYIKEDLIIPQHHSFYEMWLNKARGKSGPLFIWGVKEDVRLINDATVETEESHAGKVVLRSWYERNKHVFPASRWEVYDPEKDYGKYSIKGDALP